MRHQGSAMGERESTEETTKMINNVFTKEIADSRMADRVTRAQRLRLVRELRRAEDDEEQAEGGYVALEVIPGGRIERSACAGCIG